jgi:hypothetical protein
MLVSGEVSTVEMPGLDLRSRPGLPGKKWVDGRDFYVLDYLSTLAERYPNSATSLGAIGDYTKKVRNPLCPPDIGFARWVKEQHGLRLRFLIVREGPTHRHSGIRNHKNRQVNVSPRSVVRVLRLALRSSKVEIKTSRCKLAQNSKRKKLLENKH